MNTYILAGKLYEKIVNDLLTLSVPANLVDLHLAILNNYSGSAFGLKMFGQLDNDPVAAIGGLNSYSKNVTVEETMVSNMAKYLRDSGIIFNENEPGYGWNSL